MFYNEDCITGSKEKIKSNSIDLIITDPPYGIDGDKLDKHYNRNESNVIDGYVEVPASEYDSFSNSWIKEAERILKPGGSIYIVSGYTNLRHILNALAETKLSEINHIIWKYNFGVYTSKKYISSHYHILFYRKPGKDYTFNTNAFFADYEKDDDGTSLNYKHREDVWNIKKEYKPNQIKNKNELPSELLTKMILYSSNENDIVFDFFLGSFSTAKVAIGLNRKACGFELNKNAFEYQLPLVKEIKPGSLLNKLRNVPENKFKNKGNKIDDQEKNEILKDYLNLSDNGNSKKEIINQLSEKYKRGYWSLTNIIDEWNLKETVKNKNNLNKELSYSLFQK